MLNYQFDVFQVLTKRDDFVTSLGVVDSHDHTEDWCEQEIRFKRIRSQLTPENGGARKKQASEIKKADPH